MIGLWYLKLALGFSALLVVLSSISIFAALNTATITTNTNINIIVGSS